MAGKKPAVDLYEFERTIYAMNDFDWVCGADEAGRGPLAGPVFAAAVILPKDEEIPGLNDSKKLTEKKREALFDIICEKAVAYAIVPVDEKTIDEINILAASMLGMKQAVEQLAVRPDIAFIDGNRVPNMEIPAQAVVKGDATSASIAAASILAKVSRDRFMLKLAEEYPQYAFEKHKGYPTELHYQKIGEYGVSPVHRKSFLKSLDAHLKKLVKE
ncbi:MAG: ribonuclease HII [Oscillospiraceae bacterium]|nr:ribonuclease HII [Oscillospiraceae bacterium]MBR6607982.1 ribonuclease HII [Oscillospiraceae bacterium]